MIKITRASRALAALGAAGLLGLSACGGGSGTSSASKAVASLGSTTTTVAAPGAGQSSTDAASFQDALLAYAQCMRDHGVDMADPQFDTNGRPQFGGAGGVQGQQALRDDPDFAAAQTACQDKLAGVRGGFNSDPAQQAQRQERLLKFAECMRGKGIDFPDPTFDANGRPQFGGQAGQFGPGNRGTQDAATQAAFQACQTELGGGPGGPGGPGGASNG